MGFAQRQVEGQHAGSGENGRGVAEMSQSAAASQGHGFIIEQCRLNQQA